ncbi:hypothetical protein [Siccirubricoccus sp. G192]|nr:hypothetical protein [Siccirubricoccus sp. G192]
MDTELGPGNVVDTDCGPEPGRCLERGRAPDRATRVIEAPALTPR